MKKNAVYHNQWNGSLATKFDSLLTDEQLNEVNGLKQLNHFAHLNAEGFRKIIKKYDKKLGSHKSQLY